MTEEKTARDQALDLLFYAPLGLALSVDELLPELAAKGRQQVAVARVFGQLAVQQGPGAASRALARLEEKAAVLEERAAAIITALLSVDEEGTNVAEDVAPNWSAEPRAQADLEAAVVRLPRDLPQAAGAAALAGHELPADEAAPADDPMAEPAPAAAVERAAVPSTNGARRSPRRNGSVPAAEPVTATITVETLAIPDYESLSASQVVPRLAGLSTEERAAVAQFETANRGRRTILNRINQLEG